MNKKILIKKNVIGFLVFALLFFLFSAGKTKTILNNIDSYITTEKSEDAFTISESGKSSPLFVSTEDYPGVIRVAKMLQTDIKNVSNTEPSLTLIDSDKMPEGSEVILIGTIGKNSLIDNLIEEKKINVSDVKGKWETFIIETVDNPFPNVDHALVITGSDKRGTIYGIFDLSEKMGISPWYWWADVPVKKKNDVYVLPGEYTNGEPKVKYRGIFINDEAPALANWSMEKYGTVQFNHELYDHMFELILRLKGNFLWPAMWGRAFYDDDSLNPKLADEYGIVISTSHHEPMMRAHVEWERYGSGPWNYATNEKNLQDFWRKGIERMNGYESIITLAMRGDGDEAMSQDANVGLLEKIVKDQREIIEDVTGKNPEDVPQVWALYKEVQEYYDKGMRVPDDVTILLCDDNWGNIRKLPNLDSKPRKGGYGIYYHYDYVGGPRNYKWLNTIQIERTWEQMHLAYEYGANQIWIVNVGDLKPMEFPISFFLDYAWNPEKYSAENLPDYYNNWTKEQFGAEYADEIADIIATYTKYNSRRKPELLSPITYSLENYKEAETVVTDFNRLNRKSQAIYNALPDKYKDAFFQLVLYPVKACANLNALYVAAAKNHLYAIQNRAETNKLAQKVKKLFDKDAELSHYYNKIMADGKWDHMMDQTHIGYTYWQQPDQNNMPEIKEIENDTTAKMGIAIQGSENWYPENNELILPNFDKFNQQSYYFEIFNQGKTPFNFSIVSNETWVKINKAKGEIKTQERLWASIDWEKAPAGKHKAVITITGSEESKVEINININNPSSLSEDTKDCFIENNGYISIEAPNYNKEIESNGITWQTIPNLGRTQSAITPVPVTSEEQTPGGESPSLEYQFYSFSSGEFKVNAYFSPTLNFENNPKGIRYAVSIDNETPQIINMTSNPNPPDLNHDPVWNRWVANNINIETSNHKVDKPGKHVLKFWMVDPGIVLQKIVIDFGGVKPSYLGPPESFIDISKKDKAE